MKPVKKALPKCIQWAIALSTAFGLSIYFYFQGIPHLLGTLDFVQALLK